MTENHQVEKIMKKQPSGDSSLQRKATPIKLNTINKETHVRISSSFVNFEEALKKVCGINDFDLARHILTTYACSLEAKEEKDFPNIILQSLNDLQPKDSIEARLIAQIAVLATHALSSLRKASQSGSLEHVEPYANTAVKLFRLQNETIETLNRYRRGGEQKVTVTHAVVAGHTVVNNFNGVGVPPKNQGDTPCPLGNAEQRQEQIAINRADSQQCLMGGVDCMEEKALARKQKKAKKM
jgi:hypothetical protein